MIELTLKFDDWGEVQALINNLDFVRSCYEGFSPTDRHKVEVEIERIDKVRKQLFVPIITRKRERND